ASERAATASQYWITLGLPIAMAAGFTLLIVVTRAITASLRSAVDLVKSTAAGDLTRSVEVKGSDEVGQMIDSLNQMVVSLRQIVSDVSATADNVASGSEEMSSTAQQLSQGASEQAA